MNKKERTAIKPLAYGSNEGGMRAVYPIKDALLYQHGPNACPFYFRFCQGNADNYHIRALTTDMDRTDVIYGAEETLEKGLRGAVEQTQPEMVVVLNQCVPALIGDDTEGICQMVSRKTGVRIVPVNNPNYRGNQIDGYRRVVNAYITEVMEKPRKTLPRSVNILGQIPGEYNWTNNEAEVRRLLKALGLKVKCVLVGDGIRVQDIVEAPQAEANVLLYPEVGLSHAKLMEERFGTPYLAPDLPPLGIEATENWLKKIAEHFGLERQAEKLIEGELKSMGKAMSKLEAGQYYNLEFLGNKTYAIEASPFHLPAMVNYLSGELSMVPYVLSFQEYEEASYLKLKEVLERLGNDPEIHTSGDFQDFQDSIAKNYRYPYGDPWVVFGSSLDAYYLLNHGVRLQVIRFSYPVLDESIIMENPFMGFKGACFLAQRLCNTIAQKVSLTAFPVVGNLPPFLEIDEAGLMQNYAGLFGER